MPGAVRATDRSEVHRALQNAIKVVAVPVSKLPENSEGCNMMPLDIAVSTEGSALLNQALSGVITPAGECGANEPIVVREVFYQLIVYVDWNVDRWEIAGHHEQASHISP